jgi:hypothetical protein
MEDFMRKKEKDMRQFSAAEAAITKRHHLQQQSNNRSSIKRKNTVIPSSLNNNTYSNNQKSRHNETRAWWRKVRLSKTYEVLRLILKNERKRHILVISRPKFVAKHEDKVCG